MDVAGGSLADLGDGTAEVALGSKAKARRHRAEEAALAYAEATRMDPGLAAYLDQVRQDHSGGVGDEDKDAVVLATVRHMKASAASSEKERGTACLKGGDAAAAHAHYTCLLYTSPSPRDGLLSRMPSSA